MKSQQFLNFVVMSLLIANVAAKPMRKRDDDYDLFLRELELELIIAKMRGKMIVVPQGSGPESDLAKREHAKNCNDPEKLAGCPTIFNQIREEWNKIYEAKKGNTAATVPATVPAPASTQDIVRPTDAAVSGANIPQPNIFYIFVTVLVFIFISNIYT